MKPSVPALLLTLAGLSLAAVAADDPQVRAPAPVKQFSLPFFNEEGYRTMLVRGNEAHLTNPRHPQFIDMTLSLFVGDESNRVETIILSTAATVDVEARLIEGTGPVRLIRDDIEVTGESWQYNEPEQTLVIRRNAHIVFRAELGSVLK